MMTELQNKTGNNTQYDITRSSVELLPGLHESAAFTLTRGVHAVGVHGDINAEGRRTKRSDTLTGDGYTPSPPRSDVWY